VGGVGGGDLCVGGRRAVAGGEAREGGSFGGAGAEGWCGHTQAFRRPPANLAWTSWVVGEVAEDRTRGRRWAGVATRARGVGVWTGRPVRSARNRPPLAVAGSSCDAWMAAAVGQAPERAASGCAWLGLGGRPRRRRGSVLHPRASTLTHRPRCSRPLRCAEGIGTPRWSRRGGVEAARRSPPPPPRSQRPASGQCRPPSRVGIGVPERLP